MLEEVANSGELLSKRRLYWGDDQSGEQLRLPEDLPGAADSRAVKEARGAFRELQVNQGADRRSGLPLL